MPTRANALAIMAKAPLRGAVKTRLVPPLTPEQAADLCRALLSDQLDHLSNLAGAERYLAYEPADAEEMMRELGGDDYRYLAQRGGDLGARMNQVFGDLWQRGHRSIVLIGGDLPALPTDILDRAFAELGCAGRKVVLGPSRDGGYYLVGMNQATPELFMNMTWSHDRVLAETRSRLEALSVPWVSLPSWFDIDTIEDLRHLQEQCAQVMRQSMPRTQACLEQLRPSGCLKLGT